MEGRCREEGKEGRKEEREGEKRERDGGGRNGRSKSLYVKKTKINSKDMGQVA